MNTPTATSIRSTLSVTLTDPWQATVGHSPSFRQYQAQIGALGGLVTFWADDLETLEAQGQAIVDAVQAYRTEHLAPAGGGF